MSHDSTIYSNIISENVYQPYYRFDPAMAVAVSIMMEKHGLPQWNTPITECIIKPACRNKQTPELLAKVESALGPCKHTQWLQARGISDTDSVKSIDIKSLSKQDLLDMMIMPEDHVLAKHGERIVEGPVFPDYRDGKFVGMCIRNITNDLGFASIAKYSSSNFGWYLDGYDLYESTDHVIMTEGPFDALALRANGHNAISISSCNPTPMQLACILKKYKNVSVCFDNDLYGRVGSYVVHRATKWPILAQQYKDPGEYFEHKQALKLREVHPELLKSRLEFEIADYNRKVKSGWVATRPLKYN